MEEITVRGFWEHTRAPIGLELLAGEQGLERRLRSSRIQKPGLALAGFTSFIHGDRVQILGETELSYLDTLSPIGRRIGVEGLLRCKVACLLITKGLTPPIELIEACRVDGTPLFRTKMTSSLCIRRVLAYLDDLLSPRCSIHGVLVDVSGVGVLLTGESGIGKSECALDLVSRGHRLVADDVVEIRRRGEDLVGQASSLIQNLIEVRGLGIINIVELFGVAATREHKRVELHIQLEPWSPDGVYDRTGLEERSKEILGVSVRSLLVPVSPGRNVAGIVEVAARNFLLQLRGHHAAHDLNDRISHALEDGAVRWRQRMSATLPETERSKPQLRRIAPLTEVTDHIEDEVE